MKIETKYLNYVLPSLLLVLSAVLRSPAFAYASCLALALGFTKEIADKVTDKGSNKSIDDVHKHKLEALEAAVSAMVARERARGF